MTDPLAPPPKKDPRRRTRVPVLPPAARSRAALGLAVAAAQGRFALQHCAECGAINYPPRDACPRCLSVDLGWRDVDPAGTVLAETVIRVSPDRYFRERLPWRMGSVKLDAGPVILCHLHGEVRRGDRVRMALRLDRAGQGAMTALPENGSEHMQDDPTLRDTGAHPRHRRVLITDARAPAALPLAWALLAAGASRVMLGEPEPWLRWDGRAAFEGMEGVDLFKLDVTDTASVRELAAEIGGKVDILINTAAFRRPGGVMGGDTVFAAQAMEVNVLGLMRLAQGFGPGMAARAQDGTNNAAAFVNILPVESLVPDGGFAGVSASHAAARSVAQSLAAEFAASGLRVLNVYAGPVEDEWHQPLPPPKLTLAALPRGIVAALEAGLEEAPVGDVARDIYDRWRADSALLERERRGGTA
jgi:NAD(P)-dependent dehydrogenase (short-subunit alcohol dehydrogenase family)/uncharacterized OB-fold protein